MRPNFILISISYFYLLHAFWLGVGAFEIWSDTGTPMINSFDFPVITWPCLLAVLSITIAALGILLRLMVRWAYYGAVALSSLALIMILGLIISGIVREGYGAALVAYLLGLGCHVAVLWLLQTNRSKIALGHIPWRRIVIPGLCGIMTIAWLFLAIVYVRVEERRGLHIVLKPYPTFWSIYSYKIDILPRDMDGFVQKSDEKKWYRNWDYLQSYQLPLPVRDRI
jgi:hypothetical protein